VIGDEATALIRDGDRSLQVYRTLQLSDNVFSDGDTVLVASRHALVANHFSRPEPSVVLGRMLAAVVGEAATFSANHGPNPELVLGCAAPLRPIGGNPSAVENLMNMIPIQRFP